MWFEVVGFGVGLLFGSFLNVCISRLPEHESIVTPRVAVGMSWLRHPVRWYDNIECQVVSLGIGAAGAVPGLRGGDFVAVSGGGVGGGLVDDARRSTVLRDS